MRIGIITFWETQDNYGQIMQAYALQRTIEGMGHEPFLIKYSLFSDWAISPNRWKSIFNRKKLISYFKRKLHLHPNIMISTKVDRKFDQFKTTNLKSTPIIYHSLKELQKNPPKADVYICGSDQIWYAIDNYHVYKNITRAYFLDFGDDSIRKIAYAPSFGRTDYPQEYCNFINPLLKKFQLVTVREQGGIDVCKRAGYNKAMQVLDPTCLLTIDEYKKINIKPNIKGRYILLYLLGKNNFNIEYIMDYASKNNYEIIYIGSQGESNSPFAIYPTINEWLGWIEHCELFITNSFHGSVFSVLFNRQNIIITNNGLSRKGNDDRFYTLLKSIGLLERIYQDNIDQLVTKKIDYDIVNKKIKQLRDHDLEILKNAIENTL